MWLIYIQENAINYMKLGFVYILLFVFTIVFILLGSFSLNLTNIIILALLILFSFIISSKITIKKSKVSFIKDLEEKHRDENEIELFKIINQKIEEKKEKYKNNDLSSEEKPLKILYNIKMFYSISFSLFFIILIFAINAIVSGYAKASTQKDFKVITIENQKTYVIIVSYDESFLLCEAEISENNISIFTSRQKIINNTNIRYEYFNFDKVIIKTYNNQNIFS